MVYDYDSSGKHDFIGEFTSTFQEMQEGTANPGQEVPPSSPTPTPATESSLPDPWENPEGDAEEATINDRRWREWKVPKLSLRTEP